MRIRTVKPEFFLHESLFDLERELSLPVRLSFIGLWCAADREGRFKWEPRKLKAQILPYDDTDFSRVLDALATRGFVVRYASNGVQLGCIPSFLRHQVINNRERPSVLPAPPKPVEPKTPDASLTREPRVDDACPTPLNLDQAEGKGREGKGTDVHTHPAREILSLEQVQAAVMTSGIPDEFVSMVYDSWCAREGKDGAGVRIEIAPYVRNRWVREQNQWRNGTHKLHPQHNGVNGKPDHRAERRAKEYPQDSQIKAKRLVA